jgi:hypothetical protein
MFKNAPVVTAPAKKCASSLLTGSKNKRFPQTDNNWRIVGAN